RVAGPVSAGYPPTGAGAPYTTGTGFTAGKRLVPGSFEIFTGLLRFDTSGLPDGAAVTGAELTIGVNATANADGRSLVGEWYDGAAWPIDAADATVLPSGSALAGVPVGSVAVGAVSSFALQNVSSVSTTAYTALRFGLSGGQPAGN